MICSIDSHTGDPGLGRHLAMGEGNEAIRLTDASGLLAPDISGALVELKRLAYGSRSLKPLCHAIANPAQRLSDAEWTGFWSTFEIEFGLELQPFFEVEHVKIGQGGRVAPHRHRVYLRVQPDGRLIQLAHSAARAEKVSRISEVETGQRLIAGCYNRSVSAALRAEGRAAVADRMDAAGLLDAPRPVAVSSAERQQAERLADMAADEIWTRTWDAWRKTDTSAGLVQAAADLGLILASGDKGPVVVAPGGSVTSLRRAVAAGAKRAGHPSVRKRDIDARLNGLVLPQLDTVKAGLSESFEAGVAGILGRDRNPLPQGSSLLASMSQLSGTGTLGLRVVNDLPAFDRNVQAVDDTSEQRVTPKVRVLTTEQEQALRSFMDALDGGAREEVARAQREAEARVREPESQTGADLPAVKASGARTTDVAAKDGDRRPADRGMALKRRMRAAIADLQPTEATVESSGWRDAFRADLARLPRTYGAWIAWVDKVDADRRTIRLKDGSTIVTTSTRATAHPIAGPAATILMVAHAKARGWNSVTLTGGTAAWREEAARRCAREGLSVSNPELAAAVADEREKVARAQEAMTSWRHDRVPVEVEPDDAATDESSWRR